MEISPLASASWIWKQSVDAPQVDLYLCFRRVWEWNGEGSAWVDLSVDSDFVLYLNGKEVGRGQFPDFPHRKTWSRYEVTSFLEPGRNVIGLLVFYRGEGFSDYARGEGGLLFGLQAGRQRLVSDGKWRYRRHPAFESGVAERVTSQAGFTFRYDARWEEPWTIDGFDDSAWPPVAVIQEKWQGGPVWETVSERPLPPLKLGDPLPVSIVSQGRYIPTKEEGESGVAEVVAARAMLPLPPCELFDEPVFITQPEWSRPQPDPGEWLAPRNNGSLSIAAAREWYIIIDLGAIEVGLLTLEVTARAGTRLEFAHGEHLEDGRVRMLTGGRHFADRYICADGRHAFEMPFRRIGARYLEVHGSAPILLHCFSLRPIASQCRREGQFWTEDPLANRLHEVATRTLELCRHDHFEDCPWRERSLYAFDGRLQALYGYYAFGDYRFAEVSLSLLGESFCEEDGTLALTAPGKRGRVIPGFSFHWICALAEHWLFSGRGVLFKKFRQAVEGVLRHAFSRYDAATGLYHVPCGDEYWHFYEWSEGLTGEIPKPPFHAAYQLLLHSAARSYLWMLQQENERDEAVVRRLEALREAILHNFGVEGWLASFSPGRQGCHEFVQTLAMLEGIPVTQYAGKETPAMLACLYFSLNAALVQAPGALAEMVERLNGEWNRMLFSGATSLWETTAGARAFWDAGSLCHGWSALPVYYYYALVLGVRPLEPGFRRFALRVYPDRLQRATGSVPTPFGAIHVAWELKEGEIVINARGPEACRPHLEGHPDRPVGNCQYNGFPLATEAQKARCC